MEESIRALRQRLETTHDKLEQVDILLEMSRLYLDASPDDAIEAAKKGVELARLRKDRDRTARALIFLALGHERRDDHDQALRHLRKALAIARAIEAPGMEALALQQIGIVFTNTGTFPSAIESLEQGLGKALQAGDRAREAMIHNSIGVAWFEVGHHGRALEHYQTSRRLFESLGNRQGLLFANNNIGTVYLAIDEVLKAYEHFLRNTDLMSAGEQSIESLVHDVNLATALFRMNRITEGHERANKALADSRALRTTSHEAYLLHLIGGFVQDIDQRLEYFSQALELTRKSGDPTRVSIATSIGLALMESGRHDEARELLLATLEETERIGDLKTLADIHSALSRLFERVGDAAQALTHHKTFTRLNEELHGQEQQRRIAEMEMRAEIEQAERDREILRLEKLRLEQEMAHKTLELTAMTLHLIEKNQFLKSLKSDIAQTTQESEPTDRSAMKGLLRRVQGNLHAQRDWKAFETQFESIHQDFLHKVATLCPSLSRTELRVCALLKLNMSSKDVADILSVSVRTAENHRYKIRKKLGLADDINISTYFAQLGG